MQEVPISNPPVVTKICDLNKSRGRQHRSLKLDSKLKYLNKKNHYSNLVEKIVAGYKLLWKKIIKSPHKYDVGGRTRDDY